MERNLDLGGLIDFHAVATHGGFSAASRALRVPKGTLSRRIRALERDLGVRLFERGPRHLRLTDEGEALRARTAQALADLSDAGDAIAGRAGRPRGRLRVSIPGLFATQGFGTFAARFAAAYPEVLLDVSVQDRFDDLVADNIDVVVRVNPAPDSPLVGRRLVQEPFVVAARKDVARPQASGEIVPAVILSARPDAESWTFETGGGVLTVRPRPVLRLASMVLVRDAVLAGAGAGILPEHVARSEIAAGRLERWGTLKGRAVELWVLTTARQQRSAKVTAFMDLFSEAYAK